MPFFHARAKPWTPVRIEVAVVISPRMFVVRGGLDYDVPLPHYPLRIRTTNLSLGAPDALHQAVALGEAVQGIVALAHGADEAAQSVDLVLAGDGTAVLVNLGDGNLNGAVVLGLDDAVGSAALARDVAVKERNISNSVRSKEKVFV